MQHYAQEVARLGNTTLVLAAFDTFGAWGDMFLDWWQEAFKGHYHRGFGWRSWSATTPTLHYRQAISVALMRGVASTLLNRMCRQEPVMAPSTCSGW